MQVFRLSYGVRGFVRLNAYAVRWAHMITTPAKERARILSFWEKHGLEATKEAFGAKRSPSMPGSSGSGRAGGSSNP